MTDPLQPLSEEEQQAINLNYPAVFTLVPHTCTSPDTAAHGINFIYPDQLTRYAIASVFGLTNSSSISLTAPLLQNEPEDHHTTNKMNMENGRMVVPRRWLESSVARKDMQNRRFRVHVKGDPLVFESSNGKSSFQKKNQAADARNRLLKRMEGELFELDEKWRKYQGALRAEKQQQTQENTTNTSQNQKQQQTTTTTMTMSSKEIKETLLPPDPFAGIRIIDDVAVRMAAQSKAEARKSPQTLLNNNMMKNSSSSTVTGKSEATSLVLQKRLMVGRISPQNAMNNKTSATTNERRNPKTGAGGDADDASGSGNMYHRSMFLQSNPRAQIEAEEKQQQQQKLNQDHAPTTTSASTMAMNRVKHSPEQQKQKTIAGFSQEQQHQNHKQRSNSTTTTTTSKQRISPNPPSSSLNKHKASSSLNLTSRGSHNSSLSSSGGLPVAVPPRPNGFTTTTATTATAKSAVTSSRMPPAPSQFTQLQREKQKSTAMSTSATTTSQLQQPSTASASSSSSSSMMMMSTNQRQQQQSNRTNSYSISSSESSPATSSSNSPGKMNTMNNTSSSSTIDQDARLAKQLREEEAKRILEADLALARSLEQNQRNTTNNNSTSSTTRSRLPPLDRSGGGGGTRSSTSGRNTNNNNDDDPYRARPGESDEDFARRLARQFGGR